jgi:hypothetical protein
MNQVRVKIEQVGGKYGAFKCPVCGEAAHYKFSAASGGCDNCKSGYSYVGGLDLISAEEGKFGTHWMELQVEVGDRTDADFELPNSW